MTKPPQQQTALDQLMSRYFSLRQELEIAYRQTPWQSHSIDRLANEVSAAELSISMARAAAGGERSPGW
jgi:hypothetical protein